MSGLPRLRHSCPMIKFIAALLVAAPAAFAQTAGGYSVDPSKSSPDYSATVAAQRPSPAFTQDRAFSSTRFWLLDPGRYEVEIWCSQKRQRGGTNETLGQVEIEIGLAPHLQIDLYQNFNLDGSVSSEGQQIEMRYSFGLHYNDIPFNPVLYLEWHPRHHAQDRAEARLLLGGDVGKVLWAANLFYEMNVDGYNAPVNEGKDLEVGATAAASYGFGDYVRVGAEVKAGGDMHGGPSVQPMFLAGPNVLLKLPSAHLKLTATLLIGAMDQDPKLYPWIIAGWGF